MISRRQLRSIGVTWSAERHRVRAGRLFEVLPGVFSVTPDPSADGRLAAALLWAGGTLGHESVLEAHGLAPRQEMVHGIVLGRARPSPAGVLLHRTRSLPATDRSPVRGLPATSVGRALLDIAPRTPHRRLRALVHEAQFHGLVDPISLERLLRAHPGHPGLRALAAVDPAPRGAESSLEALLRRVLAPLPGPPGTPQLRVRGLSGRRYRGDMGYEAERVLVEADGRSAHVRMLSFESDRERDGDLAAVGWLTLRYTAAQLRAVDTVRAQVLATLRSRGGGPSRSRSA
jgi:hypothetical protein